MNTKNLKQKMLLWGTGVGTSAILLGSAFAARASDLDDVTASTTAAIKSGRDVVLGLFFNNIAVIFLGVAALAIVLWGLNKILHPVRGGKGK